MTRICLPGGDLKPLAPIATVTVPFISVIVPVRNEAGFIRATLEQLLAQAYDPARFEILVADGDSTDGTPDIVRALAALHPNLHLVHNPDRLSSAGRNRAIEAARGDLLVVVDGHCDLSNPQYLADLADAFERSGADCVGRPQPLDVREALPLQRAIAAARSSRLGHQPESFIYSAEERFVPPESVAIAYRREVFEKIGLFDERFDACEDVEFNHRVAQAGLRCFFTPRVKVHYYPRTTLAGLFRQMARYGSGRVRLFRKHRDTFTLACFVPGLFVLGLLLGPVFSLHSVWLAAGFLGSLALYTCAILVGWAMVAGKTSDRAALPWIPLVFVTIHLGAGWGIVSEFVAGWRPRTTARRAELRTALVARRDMRREEDRVA
jgi:succinoglycan biosynthesis protein ExoA